MLIAKMIQFVVFGPMRVSEKQVSFSIKHPSHMHTKEALTFQTTLFTFHTRAFLLWTFLIDSLS